MSETLKCREYYETPEVWESCNQKHALMCCTGHEVLFSQDFKSEDEDLDFFEDLDEPPGPLNFVSDFSQEVQDQLNNFQMKREQGNQCEVSNPVDLAKLSSEPIYSTNLTDKTVYPRKRIFGLNHVPLVVIPSEPHGSFCCKMCCQTFVSGQALGGHISRKHPKDF